MKTCYFLSLVCSMMCLSVVTASAQDCWYDRGYEQCAWQQTIQCQIDFPSGLCLNQMEQWTGNSGNTIDKNWAIGGDLYELDSDWIIVCSYRTECVPGEEDEEGNPLTCEPDLATVAINEEMQGGYVNYGLPCF